MFEVASNFKQDSYRILLLPIQPLQQRINARTYFNLYQPGKVSLRWHYYEQTVMENMCALFLELDGGGKRIPWHERPSLAMTIKERGHSEVSQFHY